MKKLMSTLLSVFFILNILTLQISAQNTNSKSNSLGSIMGEVINSENKNIEGIKIGLYNENETGIETLVQSTLTDQKGKYLFENLNIGKYVIKLATETKSSNLDSQKINVSVTTDNLDIKLSEKYVVYASAFHNVNGKVAANNPDKPELGKTPLENAIVGIYAITDVNLENPIATAITDAQGAYTFNNIPTDKMYNIKIISVPTGFILPTRKIDLTLQSTYPMDYTIKYTIPVDPILSNIKGIVQNNITGQPLANSVIQIKDSSNTVILEITTAEDGRFSIEKLRYGNYTIVQTAAQDGYIASTQTYRVIIDDTYIEEDVVILNEEVGIIIPGGDTADNIPVKPSPNTPETNTNININTNTNVTSPKTSDQSNPITYVVVISIALVSLYFTKKRKDIKNINKS